MVDIGHEETELILRETEREVRQIYLRAQSETQAKLDDYLSRFATKDAIKKQQLKEGKITPEKYKKWRKGQICISKRWQEMVDTLTQDYVNADKLAMSIVNGYVPEVYALNHNYATFQIERDSWINTSYTLYDRQTVERLIRDNPNLLPPPGDVDIPKDKRWNKTHIKNEIMQGILQGEDLQQVSKRLQKVTGMDDRAAMRNARTAMTGAQNAGRVDAYKRAKAMGIRLEQEWLATLDGRTRHSHRQMDGQHVEVGEKFSNKCRFPGDPEGPPWEVYNCRCTLVPRIAGVDQTDAPRDSRLGGMTYEEWKDEHNKPVTNTHFSGVRAELGDDFVDGMETLLNFTEHSEVREVFYKYQDLLKVTDSNLTGGGAYFSPDDGGVHMNAQKVKTGGIGKPYQTAFHEFSHNIDYAYSNGEWASKKYNNGALAKSINSDFDKFARGVLHDHREFMADDEIGMRYILRQMDSGDHYFVNLSHSLRHGEVTMDQIWSKHENEIVEYFMSDMNRREDVHKFVIEQMKGWNLPPHASLSLSDAVEYCTRVSYPLGYGHGSTYWGSLELEADGTPYYSDLGNGPLEFFAEVCDGMIANPDSLEQLKRVFPNAVGVVGDILKEMLK